MNSPRILLPLLVILSLATYYFVVLKEKSNSEDLTADRGFAVTDFSSVSKIVIKHVKLQPMVFTRNKTGWLLNQSSNVDPAVFSNIQAALTGMRMLYMPPAATTSTVMKSIRQNGIQVDIYTGNSDSPEKIFFIGTDTQKGDGTFMLLNGSDQPYVMHLPGLHGGLRSRFEQPEKNYRDKFIYQFPLKSIQYIQVKYPKHEVESFQIQVQQPLSLTPLLSATRKPAGTLLEAKLIAYADQFASTGTEGLFNDFPLKDSLFLLVPDCIITIAQNDKTVTTDKFYSFEHFMERNGIYRTPPEIRSGNRMFILRNDKDLFLAQNKVIGPFFTGFSEFYTQKRDMKR